ncbi:ABC transporter domain protein, partial [Bordetella bronchiseptica D993]
MSTVNNHRVVIRRRKVRRGGHHGGSWKIAYAGTVLLISHDTEFLDAVARAILHFDQAKLQRYRGGYQDFLLQRAERLRQANIA